MPNISEMLWIAGIALVVALIAIWAANNVDAVESLVPVAAFSASSVKGESTNA